MELKTIGLTKKFGSKTAVDNLNITLTNGVYGLLGANGAGKTTLMRLLCNIQTPTSGKIMLNGRSIVELGEKYRNLLGFKQSRHQRRPCPLTVRMPSRVVAVIPSRWATAISFFMASVILCPQTTST